MPNTCGTSTASGERNAQGEGHVLVGDRGQHGVGQGSQPQGEEELLQILPKDEELAALFAGGDLAKKNVPWQRQSPKECAKQGGRSSTEKGPQRPKCKGKCKTWLTTMNVAGWGSGQVYLGHISAPMLAVQELKMGKEQCDQVSRTLKAQGWNWLASLSFIRESGWSVWFFSQGYVDVWRGL